MTVRTTEGKHFRMVIGKQELMTGHEMFLAILKAKYLQALKLPDKPKQPVKKDGHKYHKKSKVHGGTKGNHNKSNNSRRMGKHVKRQNSDTSEGKSKLEPGKVQVSGKEEHA